MKLFQSKLFIFILVMALIACGIMLYSFLSGRQTPVSNLMGAVITPLENGVSHVTDWFSGLFGYFYRYNDLQEENARLRQQVAEYQKLEADYHEAIAENEQLRRLTRLQVRHQDFDCQIASVVSVVGTGFQSSFTISRGTVDGIEVGDCVVTDEGVVGYISQAGLNYSTVITILNLDSKIGAAVSRTREVVVAQGDFQLAGDGRLRVSYLKNDADIEIGDWIETAGGSDVYPKGLLIGQVVDLQLESHGISSYAVIEPVVDVQSLSSVFVIRDYTITE